MLVDGVGAVMESGQFMSTPERETCYKIRPSKVLYSLTTLPNLLLVFLHHSILMSDQTTAPNTSSSSSANTPSNRLDFGKLQHGCEHYRRRCRIVAPCCNRVFTCRHCHNHSTSSLSDPKERHELVRFDVQRVVCAVCNSEQPVAKVCGTCGVNMGEYFCEVCRFYDDQTDRKQFHCDECGICRVGGRENFFHCSKCGSCYTMGLRNNHSCVENSMKSSCPICYEYLFDSVQITQVMKCGHTIHTDCFTQMLEKNQYRCPMCSKSTVDMSSSWRSIDEDIAATPMPEECRYEVLILCNDCNSTSSAKYHIFGHKCAQCNSYNTRVTQRIDAQPEIMD